MIAWTEPLLAAVPFFVRHFPIIPGAFRHRIGGSTLFIFFTLYILSLLGVGFAAAIFHNWVVQIILLIFGLFHAINGLRITILDLFPRLIEHYRTAIIVEWAAYIVLIGFALLVVLRSAFRG